MSFNEALLRAPGWVSDASNYKQQMADAYAENVLDFTADEQAAILSILQDDDSLQPYEWNFIKMHGCIDFGRYYTVLTGDPTSTTPASVRTHNPQSLQSKLPSPFVSAGLVRPGAADRQAARDKQQAADAAASAASAAAGDDGGNAVVPANISATLGDAAAATTDSSSNIPKVIETAPDISGNGDGSTADSTGSGQGFFSTLTATLGLTTSTEVASTVQNGNLLKKSQSASTMPRKKLQDDSSRWEKGTIEWVAAGAPTYEPTSEGFADGVPPKTGFVVLPSDTVARMVADREDSDGILSEAALYLIQKRAPKKFAKQYASLHFQHVNNIRLSKTVQQTMFTDPNCQDIRWVTVYKGTPYVFGFFLPVTLGDKNLRELGYPLRKLSATSYAVLDGKPPLDLDDVREDYNGAQDVHHPYAIIASQPMSLMFNSTS